MTSVGETLRRERVKRNLDLDEISRELKISSRFLQAIESDQYDKLPGGVFAKSFVRQYARLLGLDEAAIAGQVQQVLAPEIPQFAEKSKPGGQPLIQVPKVDEWETVGDRRFRWSGWLSAALFVAVMLVCSAVYAWIQRPKYSSTAQVTPPAQTAPAQSAPVQSPPPQPAPNPEASAPPPTGVAPAATAPQLAEQRPPLQKPVEARPAEVKPDETGPLDTKAAPAVPRATPPNPDVKVRVEITAEEPVWMLARADGKFAFSATVDPHTTRVVEGIDNVTLRLGNAGVVTILLNGKPIGPAGPKGQVRTLQFTSGGFHIVPASPPLEPLGRL